MNRENAPAKRALALADILSNAAQTAKHYKQLVPIKAFHWKKQLRLSTLAQVILSGLAHKAPRPNHPCIGAAQSDQSMNRLHQTTPERQSKEEKDQGIKAKPDCPANQLATKRQDRIS
jgi:hypothetical protein